MPFKLERRLITSLFVFIFFMNTDLSASGPVSHVYYGQLFFKFHSEYTEEDKKAFLIGTLFPDIRYLNKVQREKTHGCSPLPLNEIKQEKDPFTAGMQFHAWLDVIRQEYVDKSLFQRVKWLKALIAHPESFLKILEDQAIFSRTDKKLTIEALPHIYPQEKCFGMDEETIKKWHALLLLSLTHKPNEIFTVLVLTKKDFFNIPAKEVSLWLDHLKTYGDTEGFKEYFSGLDEYIKSKMNL